MKAYAGALAVMLAIGSSTAVPILAQENREQANVERRDDSAYYSNSYYKQGWKDGSRHKRKNHHWKNDADRNAYEAGYVHGDRGEPWQEPHRDHDHQ